MIDILKHRNTSRWVSRFCEQFFYKSPRCHRFSSAAAARDLPDGPLAMRVELMPWKTKSVVGFWLQRFVKALIVVDCCNSAAGSLKIVVPTLWIWLKLQLKLSLGRIASTFFDS